MTSFTVLVNKAPFSAQGAFSAYQFSKAVLVKGHKLSRIFFYADGTQNANNLIQFPHDETNLIHFWQQLRSDYGVELIVCVAAAQRRGMTETNIAQEFKISGLGQLIEAIANTDRCVVFN